MTEVTYPPGWLSNADITELRRLGDNKRVLELGAWRGRSTVVLAEVAEYVISVDVHRGISEQPEDTLPDYLAAVRDLPNVAIVVARFQDIVPHLRSVDLVFIDGDHDFRSVERDITLALLCEPLVVAFHDWDFTEVRAAAYMFFGEPSALSGSVASFVR